jgi:cyclic pyranopterin phosphate synthase
MGFSHLDSEGRSRMVDISDKHVTKRTATASGFVKMQPGTIAAIREHRTPKGDPLETARLAGIMAAKQTATLIPLCHPLGISHADVQIVVHDSGVAIESTVTTDGKTGVEMEALTAVSIASLTIYDMCKALDKAIEITDVRLESKTGGRSGDFVRAKESA